MSRWALLLLITYVALGLSPLAAPKAARVAVLITALVVGTVMIRTGRPA